MVKLFGLGLGLGSCGRLLLVCLGGSARDGRNLVLWFVVLGLANERRLLLSVERLGVEEDRLEEGVVVVVAAIGRPFLVARGRRR